MSQAIFRLAVLPVILSMTVAGCSLAPRYHRPAAPIPADYPSYEGRSEARPGVVTGVENSADLGWRQFFQDPHLLGLIDIALQNNRDLRIAVHRVEEARAQYGIQRSALLPTVGIGANGQIQRSPEGLRMGGPESPSVSRVYQAGLAVTSFELDFFGRLRNLSEAAFQQFLATQEAQRTVHISLVAQVAQAYFILRAAEQQHELMRRTLASRQESFNIVQARFENGVAGALDVNQARGQLETVRADIEEIRREQAQAQNALRVLLGQDVPDTLPPPAVFGKGQLLDSIPAGLPSELLVRRPDIISAERNLLAANANIGAARAAFFPNISITGMLGFASTAMGGLFSGSNRFWSFAPQITSPIFGTGVRGNLDLAEARNNIAVAQYEQTIQTAFREVADALAGEATYAGQLDALRALEDSAARTLEIARMRYESGIDSFLQVQTAEVALYTAQRSFLQTGLASLMNRVDLYKALGGGWMENTPGLESGQKAPGAASNEPSFLEVADD